MAAKKRAAQNTLYTALEGGLKLLHPFMPFVTEELYQRLGRRPGDKVETIVKAKYPVENTTYANEQAEKAFDDLFEVVKTIRSLAVQENKKKDGVVFIQSENTDLIKLLGSELLVVKTLAKGMKEVTVLSADDKQVPADCSSTKGLKDSVTVYLKK